MSTDPDEHVEPYDTPSEVMADEGQVLVDGPDGVAVALTPEAALETSDRLFDAAAKALGQRRTGALRERPESPAG